MEEEIGARQNRAGVPEPVGSTISQKVTCVFFNRITSGITRAFKDSYFSEKVPQLLHLKLVCVNLKAALVGFKLISKTKISRPVL